MTFNVAVNKTLITVGDSVTYTITTDAADGTVLYLKEVGTALGTDFEDGVTELTVTVNSGMAAVSRIVSSSLNNTRFTRLSVRVDSFDGTTVTTSNDVVLQAAYQIIPTGAGGVPGTSRSSVVLPYINGRYLVTVPSGYDQRINYYVWGGAGGAGAPAGTNLGGNGGAGSYVSGSFLASPGETIEVAVGGGAQGGRIANINQKIYMTDPIEGKSASGVGPTASYGFVSDPIQAIYPQYNDPLATRTFSSWGSFMNTWAVSNLPPNQSGVEEVTNRIYFPEPGNYTIEAACDNEISILVPTGTNSTTEILLKNNFGSSHKQNFNVSSAEVRELKYTLTNYSNTSGNPAGAAILITRTTPDYMGSGTVQTFNTSPVVSTKNIIWSTRHGQNVDVTNRVPLLYAPVVNFYQPQREDYAWNGIPETGLAFLSDNTLWTEEELARLNLSYNKCIFISSPVRLTGTGNIDQVVSSGYYTFVRGQTWAAARYNWLGNPFGNTNVVRGSSQPSCWKERQWYEDGKSGRSNNVKFADWELPVPGIDNLFIVGYADGVIYNAASQRGSSNVVWQVNNVRPQTQDGGRGGAAQINVNGKYNYFGGNGGQIGNDPNVFANSYNTVVAGGGGGGGGATIISVNRVTNESQNQKINPDSIGLVANWYQDIDPSAISDAGRWYDLVDEGAQRNLTLRNVDERSMPGKNINSILFRGAANSLAYYNGSSNVFNVSGLDNNKQPKPFTIEAWTYPTGIGQNNPYGGEIINKDFEYEITRMRDGRIAIAVDWGQGQWNNMPGSGWMITDVTTPLNQAKFISVVFTNDYDCLLYVDSELRWRAKTNGYLNTANVRQYTCYRYAPRSTAYKLYVGQRSANNQGWQGYIGDVRIWNVARTQEQIAAEMPAIRYVQLVPKVYKWGVAIAGGGAGGGGGTAKAAGTDGQNEYKRAASYPLSIGAGADGVSFYDTGAGTGPGGGGAGGGGCDGGAKGDAGGKGGYAGGSQSVPFPFDTVRADFVMIGRGSDGGFGGGGGAGQLLSGSFPLQARHRIQIGGNDENIQSGTASIIEVGTDQIKAGPGGRGGYLGAPWNKNGAGQIGGVNGDSNTSSAGGSGGGGGTSNNKTTTAPGGAKSSKNALIPTQQSLYQLKDFGQNAGGSAKLGLGGAGGGVREAGQNAGERAGNGGNGIEIALGRTGKKYRLGGGGGGAAAFDGLPLQGKGGFGGGGWGAGGVTSELEFTNIGATRFSLPRGITTLTLQGVGSGGGGGSNEIRSSTGGGGGGSGGYLPAQEFSVDEGDEIEVTIGPPGQYNIQGANTFVRFYRGDNINAYRTVELTGGRPGRSVPNSTSGPPIASGGEGGGYRIYVNNLPGPPLPEVQLNGNQGESGGTGDAPNYRTGSGAGSPYASGGDGFDVTDKTAKPRSGSIGSGGAGGTNAVRGGVGGTGFIRINWDGSPNNAANPNSGSGGGGGIVDIANPGLGGTGFVAIAYPGPPRMTYVVGGRPVDPILYNGYTIHECRESGELVFSEITRANEGRIDRGNSIWPGGADHPLYVPGTAVGGVGNSPTVFPALSSTSYDPFLNSYGVWESNFTDQSFNRSYRVFFPVSSRYTFKCYVDSGAQVRFDGQLLLDLTPASRNNGLYWAKNGKEANAKVEAGYHQISWQATNIKGQGSFGLRVTKTDDETLVFDSRRPPIAEGSINGNNGLVIIELEAGTGAAAVKVEIAGQGTAWKQIKDQWVKVGGTWRKIVKAAVKINGTWRSLLGAGNIGYTTVSGNFGLPPEPKSVSKPPPPPPPDEGNADGGGGGGCKIICTALHDLGLMSDPIYAADQQFGELLRDRNPAAYYGYVRWASVVVDWIEGSGPQCMFWIRDPERRAAKQRELAIRWAYRIATPWSQHMAYRMGAVEQDSRAGRWIMKTGLAISKLIGCISGAKEPTKSVALGYAMWTVFAAFWLMAGIKGE
jgi:hypothetical protein